MPITNSPTTNERKLSFGISLSVGAKIFGVVGICLSLLVAVGGIVGTDAGCRQGARPARRCAPQ
jgi:hypothetical protein